MKVSQELSISFWLRKDARNPNNPATINLRIIIDGERDGFSLGYQVDHKKFNRKAAEVIGKSTEAIEINKHLLYVKGELIRHYNFWRIFTAIGYAAVCVLCLTSLPFLRKPKTKESNSLLILSSMEKYPSFVTEAAGDKRGTRILFICGKDYEAHPYDTYIDDAIELASYWKEHQLTYDRIVHLRTWIRESHRIAMIYDISTYKICGLANIS